MIVVDVETTGLNPLKNSLVSIGAIDFSNPNEQFFQECRIWEGAHIEDEALKVNGYTREQICDMDKQSEGELVRVFLAWVNNRLEHTVAGQNPFVDVSFIQAAASRDHFDFSLPHRIIDLHSITYFHMVKSGKTPPVRNKRTDLGSDTIMNYVGIPAEPKPHVAINGAIWEAEAFQRLFYDKSLFKQFSQYKIPWV